MDPIVSCAEQILTQSDHPALRLSELLEAVAERFDRTLDAKRLRARLEAHPDRFRILEPWKGRLVLLEGAPHVQEDLCEPWVVVVTAPNRPPGGDAPAAVRLRESVRWLARAVDVRSGSEVARWHAIALREREVRPALYRRAA